MPEITLLQINVNTANKRFDDVITYVKQKSPDIVCCEEINAAWRARLITGLGKEYPYVNALPREDNFGIGVFSKKPFKNSAIVTLGSAGVPSVQTSIEVGGKLLTLLSTHVLPPTGFSYFAWRNEQLERIADERQKLGDRLILAGDLNCTSWSYFFRRLIERTGLKDTRQGFGAQPTWPTSAPMLFIPIDHFLVSDHFVTLDREIGPNVGSDHFPVFIRLGLKR